LGIAELSFIPAIGNQDPVKISEFLLLLPVVLKKHILGFGHNAGLLTGTLTSNRYESPPSCRINELTVPLDGKGLAVLDLAVLAGGDVDFGDVDFGDVDFGDVDFAVLDLAVVALAVETRCDISSFGSQRFVSLL
jgi:hypothetical protein